MSTPVVLAALLSMQAALQSITRAGGYFYDVKATSVSLDPVELATVPTSELPYFVIPEETSGVIDYVTSRPVAVKVDFTVPVMARIDAAKGSQRQAAWQLYADIEKALAKDPQRGGVALFTYLQWPTFHFGLAAQNQLFVEVPVRVLLQRSYGTA